MYGAGEDNFAKAQRRIRMGMIEVMFKLQSTTIVSAPLERERRAAHKLDRIAFARPIHGNL